MDNLALKLSAWNKAILALGILRFFISTSLAAERFLCSQKFTFLYHSLHLVKRLLTMLCKTSLYRTQHNGNSVHLFTKLNAFYVIEISILTLFTVQHIVFILITHNSWKWCNLILEYCCSVTVKKLSLRRALSSTWRLVSLRWETCSVSLRATAQNRVAPADISPSEFTHKIKFL